MKSIREADVSGKTIFLRADLDVPVENGKVLDQERLRAWFPTLKYLLNKRAKVILAGHLGRPRGVRNPQFSLEPVSHWLGKEIKHKPILSDLKGFSGWKFAENLFLLENLRFFREEDENDSDFAKKLADLCQIYVNDAFAVSHRKNASVAAIARLLPSFAGFRLEEEVKELSRLMENPKRPLVVLVGGAKIETKLPLIDKMHNFADYVLVGGKLAEETKTLINLQHKKQDKIRSALLISEMDESGKDISEISTENFLEVIRIAKTIVWNGPVGKVEEAKYAKQSKRLAEGIIKSGAYSVVGGGDTIAFLKKYKMLDKFSFYSIGGGAMLDFLSGGKLPGLEALS